jgi:uncharacterized protein YaiL (DUF2058 family)
MSKKLSLQEQLLKSGLANKSQAQTAKTNKHKQQQLARKNNVVVTNEAALSVQQAQAEKAARDRELNQQRQEEELKKQIVAQIKQLINQHRVPIRENDNNVPYRFTDRNKVKTLYVSEQQRQDIVNGRLAIVRDEAFYALLAKETAEKVAQRDASYVLVDNSNKADTPADDDPYAGYIIPDDLMW